MRPFLAAAAITFVFAVPASAQNSISDWTVCTTGSLRACGAIQIETTPIDCGANCWETGGLGTQVLVRVRNLQGSLSYGNAAVLGLHQWFFQTNTDAHPWYYSTTQGADGLVNAVPTLAGGSASLRAYAGAGDGWIYVDAFAERTVPTDLFGCGVYQTDLSGDPIFRADGGGQTCDPLGYTGWLTYSFGTVGRWDAKDVTAVGFDGHALLNVEPGNYETGVSCNTLEMGCAVVPEPSTIILLFTGLAGLLGVSLVKLRRA